MPVPVAIGVAACIALSLRWSYSVSVDVLGGVVSPDLTLAAYLATFVLLLLGIPGFLAFLLAPLDSRSSRVLTAGSLLALLVGSLASLLWIVATVRMIGGTLSPAQMLTGMCPPAVSAGAAVWSRFHLSSESRDTRT